MSFSSSIVFDSADLRRFGARSSQPRVCTFLRLSLLGACWVRNHGIGLDCAAGAASPLFLRPLTHLGSGGICPLLLRRLVCLQRCRGLHVTRSSGTSLCLAFAGFITSACWRHSNSLSLRHSKS